MGDARAAGTWSCLGSRCCGDVTRCVGCVSKRGSDGEATLRAASTAGWAQPCVSLLPVAGHKGCCAGDSVVAGDGALSPERGSSSLALGRAGGRRALCREGARVPALPRAAAPKRRGLFPMTATSCCFSVTVQGGDPLCHTHVCRHTPTGQLTPCSGALGSSHVPRLQQHLVCPPRSPQRQACSSVASGAQTCTLLAPTGPSQGHPASPQHPAGFLSALPPVS